MTSLQRLIFLLLAIFGVVSSTIYGDHKPITLTDDEKQGIVGALTVLLFILMATEITGPEVLFLIALMIVTLCEIITLSDALSGMKPFIY